MIVAITEHFLYLGGHINRPHDVETRIEKAWAALNALSKVWLFPVKKKK